MPYKSLEDLPQALQKTLPKRAQEIYKATFNKAWNIYADASKRDYSSQEEVSHKVAWTAVKQAYYKINGHWQHKEV